MSSNKTYIRPGALARSEVIEEIFRRIEKLEERLLMLSPETTSHPALANAYAEFKIIENLTLGNENNK